MLRLRFRWFWVWLLGCGLALVLQAAPAHAAAIDPYVAKYLKVKEPVSLPINEQGETRSFTPADITAGKQLFEQSCMNCHVGGATLPDPTISLSLEDLHGATPPRDTINGLVAFLRQPMTYDGSEETFFCREVPESWMQQQQIENLSAFVLRAAQKAPGWGTNSF
jgi:photosystem II cytochrome c550